MRDWKFHCAVLGVKEDAPLKDVRKAYRKLALERHPDKHNGSQESHQDFQQLNESYKYVAAALIAGHHTPDVPPPTPRYGNPNRTARADLKREKPSAQFPKPPKNFKRVWIHAGIACSLLLAISFAIERTGNRDPAYDKNYKPDLFPKAWCFVNSHENGQELKEVAELWSQRVCEEKCGALAAKKDVSCEWSGDKFREARLKGVLPPVALAVPEGPVTAACEISVEKLNGGRLSTPYRNQTESTCRSVCSEMMKEKSRDSVHCTWSGTEFNRQGITNPTFDPGPAPIPNTTKAKASRVEVPVAERAEPPGDTSAPMDPFYRKGPCFMSVVNSEGPFAEAIPGHTAKSCESLCIAQIHRDPSGSEVKCAFGGKQIITYIPDPMTSYLERGPAGGSGFVQGNVFMATCQIHGRLGGVKNLGRAEVSSEPDCQSACLFESRKMPKGTEVVCSFDGVSFYHQVESD